RSFANDMTTFKSADNVLTLLVHLGYLGYDYATQEAFIPNLEVASEFCKAVEEAGWEAVVKTL
ncbi:MAG: AAA family ATPase, partial [Blautia sp.]